MGTRHFQKVIAKTGEVKVQQYGQWDGYPEGQGIDILKYLRTGDLQRYQRNIEKLPQITKEQTELIEKFENWNEVAFFLSRDCGAKIHTMIEWGAVPFVNFIQEKEADQ